MYVCVGIREVCHANMCEYACGVAGKDCMVYSAFHATHISTHAHVREVSRMSVCVCVCVCLCVCVCISYSTPCMYFCVRVWIHVWCVIISSLSPDLNYHSPPHSFPVVSLTPFKPP